MKKVLITSIYRQGIDGEIGNVVKIDERSYGSNGYINPNCYVDLETSNNIKIDYYNTLLKVSEILEKHKITNNQWIVIKNYLELNSKLRPKKQKKKKIYIPKIRKAKVKKVKKIKPKILKGLELINIAEFKEDYMSMTNYDLSEKYKKSETTIWLWAKKLELKRDDSYYSKLNIHNPNSIKIWNQEMIEYLEEYCNNENRDVDWIVEKTGKTFCSCLAKIRSLNLKPKKRIKNFNIDIDKIKNDSLIMSRHEVLKKYNISSYVMNKYFAHVETYININKLLIQSNKLKCSCCGNIRDVKCYTYDKSNNVYQSRCKDCKKIDTYRAKNDEIDIDTNHILNMCNYFDHKCAYCGKDIKYDYTLDHIVPRNGRNNSAKSTKDNIIISCKSCNSKKLTRTIEEWFNISEDFTTLRLDNINKWLKMYEK